MLTVYGRATSSNVQAVMWGLAELGLSADRLDYGHVYGGTDSPEFRAMSPHGLVPVLKDGDTAIWESCAIMRYLAARYGDGGEFWPADPVARAKVDMWAEWSKLTLSAQFTMPIFWSRVRTGAKDRDEAALGRAIKKYEASLQVLAHQLDLHDYVAGESFSLADVVVGHLMFRYFDIDIPRNAPPQVQAYYDRLIMRPAFREHVMVDYSPLTHPEA